MTSLTDETRVERRIVAAAILLKDGRVLCGVRHFDELMRAWLPATPEEAAPIIKGHEQGFVCNQYQFVARDEAWIIASRAGQIIEAPYTIQGVLHSEDLW